MTAATLEREAAAAVRPGNARRLRRLGVALALLGIVGAAAWYGHRWWTTGRFIESTDDAYVGGDVTAIAPKVSGLIAQVPVTDNQVVRQGDPLVKIDDRDYRAAAARAQAAIDARRADLANLDANHALQEAMVTQAQADIEAARAQIAVTAEDQSRYRQLAASAAGSVQSFQRADATFKQAVAAGLKADAALLAAQRRLTVIDTQKQQAAAMLAQARADADLAALDVGYTDIRAPIDGVVGNRSARAGGYAAAGAQLLAVVPAHGLWVDANFKESQLAGMRPGQAATITADALPGQVFQGHVASLAPATGAQFSVLPPENATGNFTKIVQRVPVRILLDGDPAALASLRPGLSVTVDIDEHDASPNK